MRGEKEHTHSRQLELKGFRTRCGGLLSPRPLCTQANQVPQATALRPLPLRTDEARGSGPTHRCPFWSITSTTGQGSIQHTDLRQNTKSVLARRPVTTFNPATNAPSTHAPSTTSGHGLALKTRLHSNLLLPAKRLSVLAPPSKPIKTASPHTTTTDRPDSSRLARQPAMENLSIHDPSPAAGASPQPPPQQMPGAPPQQQQQQQQGPPGPPPPMAVPQLPPQMFTTAAQLLDLTDSQ